MGKTGWVGRTWLAGEFLAVLASGCGDGTICCSPPPSLSLQLAPTNNGDHQTGTVGTTLLNPLRVLVQRGADPAPGVAVYWQPLQGHVPAGSTKTDASGIAAVAWTLDTMAGGQTLNAVLLPQPGASDKIAFASNKDGDSEIYVINADGSGVIQLTDNSAFDGWPAWAP